MSKVVNLILLSTIAIAASASADFLKHGILMTVSDMEPTILAATEELINVKCFFVKKYDVYTFEKLQKKTEDYVVKGIEPETDISLSYNFCQDTVSKCATGNSTLIRKEKDKCIRLTGSIDGSKEAKLYNKWDTYTDPEKSTILGVKLTFIPGEICKTDSNRQYQISYKVKCNPNGMDKDITLDFSPLTKATLDGCDFEIEGSSKAACPFLNYYIVTAFFNQYSSFLGAIVIVIGLLLGTLGLKFIKFTIVLSTALAMAVILFLIVFNVTTISEYKYVWIVLGVGLVVGIGIGCFLLKAFKACCFIIGGCFGYTIGVFLSTFILEWVSWNPEILYWIVICVSIIVFGLLTMCIIKHALIVATSFMGGYMVCKGISLYAGGFPNESTIIDLIKKQEWEKLTQYRNPVVYGYLAGIIVLTIAGIVVQEKINKDKSNNDYKKMD